MKLLIIFLLILSGCYTGTLTTGYLVSIEEGNKTTNTIFLDEGATEAFILDMTGYVFPLNEYLGEVKPYFSFENDNLYIYVEKKFFKEQKINPKNY